MQRKEIQVSERDTHLSDIHSIERVEVIKRHDTQQK